MKLLNFINGQVVETQTAGLECVEDSNGVFWYKNENLDIVVNSHLEVFVPKNNSLEKSKPYKSSGNTDTYYVTINGTTNTFSLSKIVGEIFKTPRSDKTSLFITDLTKGLVEGNFTFRNIGRNRVPHNARTVSASIKPKLETQSRTHAIEKENVIILKVEEFQSLVPEVKKIEGFKEYQTDDGSIFTNKEIADWHQKNVDKGKNNAEIVVSYGGGYTLAEQIYMQEVKYPEGKKPYKDFKVMLSQVGGIRELEKPAKFTISLDESNVKCFTDEREASLFAKKVGAFRFLETTVK